MLYNSNPLVAWEETQGIGKDGNVYKMIFYNISWMWN